MTVRCSFIARGERGSISVYAQIVGTDQSLGNTGRVSMDFDLPDLNKGFGHRIVHVLNQRGDGIQSNLCTSETLGRCRFRPHLNYENNLEAVEGSKALFRQ
jgi:hypothetical protein